MAEVGSTLVSSCHSEPLGEESLKSRRKQILRDKSLRMTETYNFKRSLSLRTK